MGVEDAVGRRERYRTKAQVHPERDVNLTGATVKWQDYGRRVSDVGNLLMPAYERHRAKNVVCPAGSVRRLRNRWLRLEADLGDVPDR